MDPTLAARALSAATEITSTALSGEDPGAVLDTVVARAAELAEADLGLVMVRADDGRVIVEAAQGALTGLRGLTLPADSAAGRVARGGEPVVSEDFTIDPRTAPFVPDELRGFGPFAAAPFGSGGRILGALTVYRRHGRYPFSAGTIEVLTAFAAQAGVVLALAEGANARHRVTLYQERERIARELHDVIVQRLYGAGMQLDRVRRNMRKRFAQADGNRLSDAIDQLDQTIEEIRGTVRALRSPDPEHDAPVAVAASDLAESARGEVRIAGELLGFPPTLELSGELANIPAERADHIRAALREALSNVVRHSGASESRVSLCRDEEGVKLRVRDNGSGVPQGVATRGLRHLAERAETAGGKFFINSSPSLGTLVAFDLPLD
ncbi:GAF domain-containing sensor histidine kinase [Amycolatopsis sp. H20-H5]|uniref:GAF domain-containing sensor histidine kinase n=1 Tax=Amycolatopsis sp. H20-H5 TaxID=3046309 RepID=UPI002DBDC5D6|nr:GAF domain-containing protein [Amycolatopsis sp. H20-H5]MEC3977946.1 GAF domain-containing protein [Amycolatopsis sp. H20-H5]